MIKIETITFTNEEKVELFDQVSSHFYNKNFGQMSKSDIELMMFHFYIEKLIKNSISENGAIDYQKYSDYTISKDLGITQQRVRNLRVKSQLIYPIEFDWKATLANLIENARYDKLTGKIIISIPDPNLYIEIQNFIEEQGFYVEKQLNSKLLQMRAEYFIELAIALEPEDNKKRIVKELKMQFKKAQKNDSAFDENNIRKSFLTVSINLIPSVKIIAPLFSSGNSLFKGLSNLLNSL